MRTLFLKVNSNIKMMRLLFLASSFFFICFLKTGYSQKIYEVNKKYKSDITAFISENEYSADLLVYKANSGLSTEGNNGVWLFVEEAYMADKKVYFVDAEYQANLVICYVKNKYQAGWRNNEKKHLFEKVE